MTVHDMVIGKTYIIHGKEYVCTDKGLLSNGSQEAYFKCRTADDKEEISGTSPTMNLTVFQVSEK